MQPPSMKMKGKSLLSEFLGSFGLKEEDLGIISRIGRKCFLVPEHLTSLIARHKDRLFGAGIYLGEEKRRMEPSPALVELVADKVKKHKVAVNEKAAWLFLCGRDVLEKGIVNEGEPTKGGFLLVQDEHNQNLGFGLRKGRMVRNVLDRGFFLRRERMA